MLIEKEEYKGKVIGRCQVCKKEIYEHERNIMGIYHEKCLIPVKENAKYIVYLIPTTNGKIKVRKWK
jgi:hypothetical protein